MLAIMNNTAEIMEQHKVENETSIKLDMKGCGRDNEYLDIDFNNIEDILDFSACYSHKTVNSRKLKKVPPRRHKMIAKEPVQLFKIQPELGSSVGQSSHDDNEKEQETAQKERRFQCNVCDRRFIRSTHLHRHMRVHTGAKPYSCKICRKRFSRSDHVQIHEKSHYKHKIHSCCVCGKLYFDLQILTAHCSSHSESKYIKASKNTARENEALIKKQLQMAQIPLSVSVCAEQIALLGYMKIEEITTHTDGEHIACHSNTVCSPCHQTTTVSSTEITLLSDDATASSTSHASDAQLIVSIKLPLQTV